MLILNNKDTTQKFYITFERSAGTFQDTTSYHDCCEFLTTGTVFIPVTVNDSLEVVSTSASDTESGGTGTRTVGILYLDQNGIWSQTTAILNGTTPVALTGIQATAIISMYALTGGSSLTSVGTINLRKVGTPTTIYEQITSGGNQSQSGRFTVPSGYYAIITHINVSVQGQPIEIKIRTTRNQFDGSTTSDRYLFKIGAKLAGGNSLSLENHRIRLDSGQSLKVSGISDSIVGNPRVHGTVTLELVRL